MPGIFSSFLWVINNVFVGHIQTNSPNLAFLLANSLKTTEEIMLIGSGPIACLSVLVVPKKQRLDYRHFRGISCRGIGTLQNLASKR